MCIWFCSLQIFANLAMSESSQMCLINAFFQHANEDVEKMILGNKCDMDDRRIVSKERGEQVSLRDLITRC